MDKDTLIASLVANYLTDSSLYIELLDEDFEKDPTGDWVKANNYWESYSSKIMRSILLNDLYSCSTSKFSEENRKERLIKHQKFCHEMDKLPKYKIITTHEYRVIRYATKKANEIINSTKFI